MEKNEQGSKRDAATNKKRRRRRTKRAKGKSESKPVLTYFNTSGRADLLRLMLEVARVDYDYEALSVPFYPSQGKDWFHYKQENADALLFGQVPRYQDSKSGVDLVQSNAIARYLATRHGLRGCVSFPPSLLVPTALIGKG